MVTLEEYGDFETAWCPGCGNFSILKALKKALVGLDLAPHNVLFMSGIGQAAKAPHYFRCNLFNGLHGRTLPAATGARLANPSAPIFVESGDGDSYGEGGNHFLAALRRNLTMVQLVHDNQIYGLTKGQASPTTGQGQKTKAQPAGVTGVAFKPLAMAVVMKVNFVARGFSGEIDHLTDLIMQAARAPGYALVDVMQPCVSFNKVNTFAWYKERCRKIGDEHDPTDWNQALSLAMEFDERIPIGVIYKNDRPAFESHYPALARGPMAAWRLDPSRLESVLDTYF